MKRTATEAMRNQFDSTYAMINNLIAICPNDVWLESYNDVPFWHQVYHFVFFIDFWIRDTYDGSEFKSMNFDERILPELDTKIDGALHISKVDMLEYLKVIQIKTSRVFDNLNDDLLGTPIIKGKIQYTYADVFIGQIRHIMYNIGYLNGCLRQRNLPESDWYSYNETQKLYF